MRTAPVGQKTAYTGNNAKALHLAFEASLKRLRASYVDIFYVHWWDYATSVEEIMNALHVLVLQGKVLYLVSNFAAPLVSFLLTAPSYSGYL